MHVPSAAAIDAAIVGDAGLKMMGLYGAGDAGVESERCCKTVYVPAPLHTVSHYASRMGRSPCRWDGKSFANRGDVTFGTAPLAHWDPAYLHLAAAVHVPSASTIDAAIAGNAGMKMMLSGRLS